MAYKVWTANADRHNDWTTELILRDGTTVRMGEPTEMSADQVKALEAEGRVVEDSTADSYKQYHEARAGAQQAPGGDIAGSAPVFANAGQSNQTDQSDAVEAAEEKPSGQSSSSRASGSGNDNK